MKQLQHLLNTLKDGAEAFKAFARRVDDLFMNSRDSILKKKLECVSNYIRDQAFKAF